jgi:type 1 glutamine amidotransferase
MRCDSRGLTLVMAMALAACSGSDEADPTPASGGTAATGPVAGAGGTGAVTTPPGPRTLSNVLVFTRTAGFRHDSIPVGITAVQSLGQANGFSVQASEDPALFNDQALAAFQVVVFLSTTADVLGPEQQLAFERYIAAGNGWVGVHAAADTEYDWPWYGGLLGGDAWFLIHPVIQNAELQVEDAAHQSTTHLPATFTLQDEWYNYRNNPRPEVNVLLRLNEASYQVGEGAMGADHPIAWYHEYAGGRAWYTGLGHRQELYSDPQFVQHLLGGIRWASGASE